MKEHFDNVMKELRLRHSEFFETQLAICIINDPEMTAPVVKISQELLQLLEQYRDEVEVTIQKQPEVARKLYDPEFYGCLKPTLDMSVFEHMIFVLKNAEKNPASALHVQTCFIQRIRNHLPSTEHEKIISENWRSKIFSAPFFKEHFRKPLFLKATSIYSLGICQSRFFDQKVTEKVSYAPARKRFGVDSASAFWKQAAASEMPIICGPSGHSGSLAFLVAVFGKLTKNECQKYALTVASFLILAGAHSLHECLIVFRAIGVQYHDGDYSSAFPQGSTTQLLQSFLKNHIN